MKSLQRASFRLAVAVVGLGVLGIAGSQTARAQGVPPTGATELAAQTRLIQSADPKLAANKKLVFDMWRVIIQGGHTEMAPQYFTESYIQHNPNVTTGRDAMVTYMKQTRPVCEIDPKITFPVIAIMADGDLVTVATVSHVDDPTAPGKKYDGTHFDMFRIENGKIAEHWDSVPKDPNALHYNPNTQNGVPKKTCTPR
ncbi:MAG TPA: ester cyclase [Steroidobacteraceae bacterium]|jgi:predicted SnoaL-like aldol condensation-catalyzing enzyme